MGFGGRRHAPRLKFEPQTEVNLSRVLADLLAKVLVICPTVPGELMFAAGWRKFG